jgi:hypothetical protein
MKRVITLSVILLPLCLLAQQLKFEVGIGNSITQTSKSKKNTLSTSLMIGSEFKLNSTVNLSATIGLQSSKYSDYTAFDTNNYITHRFLSLHFSFKKYCFRTKSVSIYIDLGLCGNYNLNSKREIFVNDTFEKISINEKGGSLAGKIGFGCRTKLDRLMDIDLGLNQQVDYFAFAESENKKIKNNRIMLYLSLIRKLKK